MILAVERADRAAVATDESQDRRFVEADARRRQREVHGNTIRAREIVLNKDRGLIRESCYAIRTYNGEDLVQLLEQVGFTAVRLLREFSPHPAKGDYGFMNRRMVAVGHKP